MIKAISAVSFLLALFVGCDDRRDSYVVHKCNGCVDLDHDPYLQSFVFTDNEGHERTITVEIDGHNKQHVKTIYHVRGMRPDGTTENVYSLAMPQKKDGMLCVINPVGADRYLDFTSVEVRHIEARQLELDTFNLDRKHCLDEFLLKKRKCPVHNSYSGYY